MPVAERQRALDVHARARAEGAERGARERLVGEIGDEAPSLSGSTVRQTPLTARLSPRVNGSGSVVRMRSCAPFGEPLERLDDAAVENDSGEHDSGRVGHDHQIARPSCSARDQTESDTRLSTG